MATKPDMRRAWANTGTVVNPGNPQIDQGWVAEKPPFQTENWVQNRSDTWLQHMEERGAPEWDVNIIYFLGGRVYYQNQHWQSIAGSNLGNTPNAGAGFWSPVSEVNNPPGQISMYGGSGSPVGWLLCDGSAISRTTYARLFAFISTIYGTGNGSTTFNIPNGTDRVMIGAGSIANLGQAVGVENVTLTSQQSGVVGHVHSVKAGGGNLTGFVSGGLAQGFGAMTLDDGGYVNNFGSGVAVMSAVNSSSASQSHTNVQPSLGINFIIKI